MNSLWVDGLWVIGLAGVVATLSHEGWQRGRARHEARTKAVHAAASRLNPQLWYSLCAVLISIGLFLSSLGAWPRTPVWMVMVWGAMVVLSCSTLIATARSVRSNA